MGKRALGWIAGSLMVTAVGCAGRRPAEATSVASGGVSHIQLYVFNRSGATVDLKVALADSVLYYAQVLSAATPSEISGGRLVHRPPGTYRVTLQDFTHGQQRQADVRAAGTDDVVYITVRTDEKGSALSVSDRRPF